MNSWITIVPVAILVAAGVVMADGDSDPRPRGETEGQWVLTTNQVTPSANQPLNYSFDYYVFGLVFVGHESTEGSASGNRPVTLNMNGVASASNAHSRSITNTGSASLNELFQWTWMPSDVPIKNKDVLMQISGTCTIEAAVQVGGNDGADSAYAEGSFSASGNGNVGGKKIVGVSVENKKIRVEAYIPSSEIKYRYKFSGDAKKTAGEGSVDADASMDEYQNYEGSSGDARTLTVKANVSATANTNNVGVYGNSLNQSISGAIGAGCSGWDESKARLSGTSNWDIAPRP